MGRRRTGERLPEGLSSRCRGIHSPASGSPGNRETQVQYSADQNGCGTAGANTLERGGFQRGLRERVRRQTTGRTGS